jgi:hypothetical protein
MAAYERVGFRENCARRAHHVPGTAPGPEAHGRIVDLDAQAERLKAEPNGVLDQGTKQSLSDAFATGIGHHGEGDLGHAGIRPTH